MKSSLLPAFVMVSLMVSNFNNDLSLTQYTTKAGIDAGATGSFSRSTQPFALPPQQDRWQLCIKCYSMFYNGFKSKGRCTARGAHVAAGAHDAQGKNFLLPYDAAGTPTAQTEWRFCNKCFVIFYNGFTTKGRCTAGGAHVAQGYNFTLPHDIRVSGLRQGQWRYCGKCQTLFSNGTTNKGRCPAGSGHEAQGYNFVLRFRGNLEGDTEQHPAEQ